MPAPRDDLIRGEDLQRLLANLDPAAPRAPWLSRAVDGEWLVENAPIDPGADYPTGRAPGAKQGDDGFDAGPGWFIWSPDRWAALQ
ncbi:MAG TPA: hypothetical protein VNC50_00240 [Planctomycetia bacterium]|nr:hypothetical protein [Planctomycetia bacterium]